MCLVRNERDRERERERERVARRIWSANQLLPWGVKMSRRQQKTNVEWRTTTSRVCLTLDIAHTWKCHHVYHLFPFSHLPQRFYATDVPRLSSKASVTDILESMVTFLNSIVHFIWNISPLRVDSSVVTEMKNRLDSRRASSAGEDGKRSREREIKKSDNWKEF